MGLANLVSEWRKNSGGELVGDISMSVDLIKVGNITIRWSLGNWLYFDTSSLSANYKSVEYAFTGKADIGGVRYDSKERVWNRQPFCYCEWPLTEKVILTHGDEITL